MFLIFVLTSLLALSAAFPFDNGRIVGGFPVDITQVKYQVSLESTEHICGGSIIKPNWVLTAAHCVYEGSASKYSVRVGSTSRNSGGEIISIKQIIVHPDYNSRLIDYDYALLQLTKSINYDATKGPVELATTDPAVGVRSIVTGWGDTLHSDESSVYLRATDVLIVGKAECKKAYGADAITPRMICAALNGKDACQGDSGGPLVSNNKLVGIVSWGAGCAQKGYPGVYSSVANGISWIKQYTG